MNLLNELAKLNLTENDVEPVILINDSTYRVPQADSGGSNPAE